VRTLTLTAVTKGDFSEKNTKITSADPRKVADLWLEPGDILVERSNAPELVGTSCQYRGPKNYAIFPDLMIRARVNEKADPSFVELVLRSEDVRRYFKSRAKGMSGSMPKIDQQTIEETPIPLPPLPEQRRIVAEIEAQFTKLDAGVAALKRVQANLKRYRAAVLKAACEGKLVPTEAELRRTEGRGPKAASIPRQGATNRAAGARGVQGVVSSGPTGPTAFETGEQLLQRILAERRKSWQGRGKYKEPVAPDTSNLPPLPEGWAWASIAALAELENGDRSKNYPSRSAFVPEGVPFINAGHLQNGAVDMADMNFISATHFDRLRAGKVHSGDILFCLRGSLGKVALVPECERGAIASSLVIIRAMGASLRPYLLCYLRSWWAHQMIAKYDNGSAQPNLSAADLARFAVPLPPLAEQTRIVAEVERRLSVIDELETLVGTNLARATRLRQAVLQQAFTGGVGR
jgi:type I restriction enzyme S subunit